MMLHRCYYFVIIHPADWIIGVKTESPAKGQHIPKLYQQQHLKQPQPSLSASFYLYESTVQRKRRKCVF